MTMNLSMRQLLDASVHFGHQTRFWHPKMAGYIYGSRNKVHIFNLERTVEKLSEASDFVSKLARNRGNLLFVGTKRQSREVIREEAARAQCPYVDVRWLGGCLTNYRTVSKSLKKLHAMEEQLAKGQMGVNKKENLMFERSLEKMQRDMGGIKDMAGVPDAVFIVDIGYHKNAFLEAKKMGLPVIAVVDSNHSPEGVDYVIPGNDDSGRAVRLYASVLADAVLAGRASATQELVAAITQQSDAAAEEAPSA